MSDAPSQLDHLKSLVSQLQAKIEKLESAASSTAKGAADSAKGAIDSVKESLSPAQHLRIVLMGPPGAGKCQRSQLQDSWASSLEVNTTREGGAEGVGERRGERCQDDWLPLRWKRWKVQELSEAGQCTA